MLTQNTDRLNKKFDQISQTAGNFGKNFAQTQKTLQFQIHALEGGVTALGVKLGDMLIPTVQKVVGWLNKFVDQMRTGQGAGGQFRRDMVDAFHAVRDAVKWFVDAVGGIKPALEIAAGAFVTTKLLKFGLFAKEVVGMSEGAHVDPRQAREVRRLRWRFERRRIADMNVNTMIVRNMIGGDAAGGAPATSQEREPR